LQPSARASGLELQHVKPHGALYNHAAKDERAAVEIIDAVKSFDPELVLFVLAGSIIVELARTIREALDGAGIRVAAVGRK
jgi:5-oxoprolinase (ATP-hydrolysing) subunit A